LAFQSWFSQCELWTLHKVKKFYQFYHGGDGYLLDNFIFDWGWNSKNAPGLALFAHFFVLLPFQSNSWLSKLLGITDNRTKESQQLVTAYLLLFSSISTFVH